MSEEAVVPGPHLSVIEQLQAAPVIDMVNEAKLALLKRTTCKGCNDDQIAQMLEIAVLYDLNPFARGEIWCRPGRTQDGEAGAGEGVIMVGRDGLRKISIARGVRIDGDVVRRGDDFAVDRRPDGSREVFHSYGREGRIEERGEILAAWVQCLDLETKEEVGWYLAYRDEHEPSEKEDGSFWAKTPSLALLTAAERSAVRRHVPLSGIMVEGEEETVRAATTGPRQIPPPDLTFIENVDLRRELMKAIMMAREIDPLSWGQAKAEMRLSGLGDDDLSVVLMEIQEENAAAAPPQEERPAAEAA